MWEEAETLHTLSPHQNVAYLDRDVLARTPDRFFHSLDSELDHVLTPGCGFHCAQREDGLALMELSPAAMECQAGAWVGSEGYAPLVWERMASERCLAVFQETVQYPIQAARRGARKALPRRQILDEMEETRRRVREGRPPVPLPALLSGLLALVRAETHPQALGPALREAAGALWRRGRAALQPGADPEQVGLLAELLEHFQWRREAAEARALSVPGGSVLQAADT
jgi:hypothetical protein